MQGPKPSTLLLLGSMCHKAQGFLHLEGMGRARGCVPLTFPPGQLLSLEALVLLGHCSGHALLLVENPPEILGCRRVEREALGSSASLAPVLNQSGIGERESVTSEVPGMFQQPRCPETG